MKKRILLLFLLLPACVFGVTLNELVTVRGVQDNEITGTGLVIGLLGTGDKKNPLKDELVASIIHNSGIDVPAGAFDTKNSALVQVSGRLPAFSSAGQQIELSVSAMGDAKSLVNGRLYYTQLRYPGDYDRIFATAAGPIEVPPGYPETSGIVRGIVQSEVPSTLLRNGRIQLLLRSPGFVDADRIARSVNQHFIRRTKRNIAKAVSAGQVDVEVPDNYINNLVGFVAEIKKIPLLLVDVPAKVRINTKTGMVTFNEKVEVSPFGFSLKDLSVAVAPQANRNNNNNQPSMKLYNPQPDPAKTDLQQLVDAFNAMRLKPEEIVEIIKEIHKIGALHAELIIE